MRLIHNTPKKEIVLNYPLALAPHVTWRGGEGVPVEGTAPSPAITLPKASDKETPRENS